MVGFNAEQRPIVETTTGTRSLFKQNTKAVYLPLIRCFFPALVGIVIALIRADSGRKVRLI